MKAVNLIPADGASASGSKSGIASYAMLAGLAVLVALSAMYTLASRSVDHERADLAAVTEQAQAAEKAAASYKQYTATADTRKSRVETVKNIADTRFDWSDSLHEVARTLPSGVWVTSMRATVSPAVNVGGATDPLRAALAAPAIELTACAKSQDRVAIALAALRQISGVQRVSLSKSAREKQSSGGSGQSDSASASSGCGSGPMFSAAVFYEADAATPATATGATGTAAPATAATASTPSTTAASTPAGSTTTTGGTR
jgi:Tfp pilus assembly protein PilN